MFYIEHVLFYNDIYALSIRAFMSIFLKTTNTILIKFTSKGDSMTTIETLYHHFLKTTFGIMNPIKKSIIRTKCDVHKHINIQALQVLRNDQYTKEYNFFSPYIAHINKGAVWADQDFKSSNHFYNPDKRKGMFGRKTAMDLGVDYYDKALRYYNIGKVSKSFFYLGAALHIIQDMTVPQHANIRLLDNHHQYEAFVKRTYYYIVDFQIEKGAYLLDSLSHYIRFNSRVALKIHKRFVSICNDEERYYKITRCTLPLATRTTAGAMVMFYGDIISLFQP